MALSDLQNYLIRRKTLYPTPSLSLESYLVTGEDSFLYRAEITDRFNGEWKPTIQGAFDSLEDYLRSIGEIV